VDDDGAAAATVRAVTVRVAVVDDEELVRTGLRAIIGAHDDLTVVAEAADGSEVPDVLRAAPDVVLMDIRMPAIDGIQATRHIVDTAAAPPKVLVLTTFENDDYVYDALRAGAAGFLLKRARPDEITAAVRLVAGGESLLFPTAIRRLAAVRATGPSSPGPGAGLTAREADVLRLMARGLSNTEIAAELVVSPETVKTHVGNVLAKLGARDRTQAVITAYESGFVNPRAAP